MTFKKQQHKNNTFIYYISYLTFLFIFYYLFTSIIIICFYFIYFYCFWSTGIFVFLYLIISVSTYDVNRKPQILFWKFKNTFVYTLLYTGYIHLYTMNLNRSQWERIPASVKWKLISDLKLWIHIYSCNKRCIEMNCVSQINIFQMRSHCTVPVLWMNQMFCICKFSFSKKSTHQAEENVIHIYMKLLHLLFWFIYLNSICHRIKICVFHVYMFTSFFKLYILCTYRVYKCWCSYSSPTNSPQDYLTLCR